MDQENEGLEEEEEREASGGGFQIEVLKSYLAFFHRALKRHWLVLAGVFAVGLTLTYLVNLYAPRRFACTTVLMAEQNSALEGFGSSYAFQSATNLILRHENVVSLVKELKLAEKAAARRPPFLKAKEEIREAIFGPLPQDIKDAIQVGTLESRLSANVDPDGNLRVSAEWTDPKTAAEIAEAAREGFVRARHSIEMSRYTDKMGVLAQHAEDAQARMNQLKEQIKASRSRKQLSGLKGAPGAPGTTPAAVPVPAETIATRQAAPRRPITDDLLPKLKEKLTESKQKLAGLKVDQENRVRDERRKLEELRLRYTPSHPEVIQQELRHRAVQQVPSEIVSLQAEVEELEKEISQRELLTRGGSGGSNTGSTRSGGAETETQAALPAEIVELLDGDELGGDPVLRSQLTDAALRYTMLKNEIISTRITMDTAQVAFNNRYKIVVPAAPPGVPFAPNPVTLLGAGFAITLLLGLILPIILELRSGKIVARWQVDLVSLPVLAELRLPPYSAD